MRAEHVYTEHVRDLIYTKARLHGRYENPDADYEMLCVLVEERDRLDAAPFIPERYAFDDDGNWIVLPD